MKNSQINLGWGDGTFDVVVDVRSGELIPYFGSEDFHHRYGGRNTYCSRSGASGAGWIPARPWLVKLETYRTDVRTSYMFDGCYEENPVTKIPSGIYVPINYQGSRIPDDYPCLFVQEGSRAISFFSRDQVSHFFTGELEFTHRHIDTPSIKRVGEKVELWELHFDIAKGCSMWGVRRVLEALHIDSLAFEWSEESTHTLNFWRRLGLSQIAGSLYKITSGIARKCYAREELSTVEALQVASPNNAIILTATLYIQEKENGYNGFDAVGIFSFDGVESDFEVYIESAEAFRAMRGDFSEIQRKLEEGALNKHRKMLQDRAQQALWAKNQAEREALFLELCKEHSEMEITLQDSLSAGNCRPGTEDFRDRTFTGRESVKVKELVRFLSVYGVRRVLEHKLLPLMPPVIRDKNEESLVDEEPYVEEIVEFEVPELPVED